MASGFFFGWRISLTIDWKSAPEIEARDCVIWARESEAEEITRARTGKISMDWILGENFQYQCWMK